MSAIEVLLSKAAANLPSLIASVNTSLTGAGTSLPALEAAAKKMASDTFGDPGATLPSILVDGAEVAFAANPPVALGIAIAYALFASGIAKPADWNSPVNIARSDDIYEAPQP